MTRISRVRVKLSLTAVSLAALATILGAPLKW